MDSRACDFCGVMYEPKTSRSKFCSPDHRSLNGKAKRAGRSVPAETSKPVEKPKRTEVYSRLERELRQLGVFDHYESATVLYLAEQLDSGTVLGTAFVSLSKELDRRVDVLRLRAVRPDDPTVAIRERVEEKQAHLRVVG